METYGLLLTKIGIEHRAKPKQIHASCPEGTMKKLFGVAGYAFRVHDADY
jgi:hypothetical protein